MAKASRILSTFFGMAAAITGLQRAAAQDVVANPSSLAPAPHTQSVPSGQQDKKQIKKQLVDLAEKVGFKNDPEGLKAAIQETIRKHPGLTPRNIIIDDTVMNAFLNYQLYTDLTPIELATTWAQSPGDQRLSKWAAGGLNNFVANIMAQAGMPALIDGIQFVPASPDFGGTYTFENGLANFNGDSSLVGPTYLTLTNAKNVSFNNISAISVSLGNSQNVSLQKSKTIGLALENAIGVDGRGATVSGNANGGGGGVTFSDPQQVNFSGITVGDLWTVSGSFRGSDFTNGTFGRLTGPGGTPATFVSFQDCILMNSGIKQSAMNVSKLYINNSVVLEPSWTLINPQITDPSLGNITTVGGLAQGIAALQVDGDGSLINILPYSPSDFTMMVAAQRVINDTKLQSTLNVSATDLAALKTAAAGFYQKMSAAVPLSGPVFDMGQAYQNTVNTWVAPSAQFGAQAAATPATNGTAATAIQAMRLN